jgi:hypothetical protein
VTAARLICPAGYKGPAKAVKEVLGHGEEIGKTTPHDQRERRSTSYPPLIHVEGLRTSRSSRSVMRKGA